MATVTCVVDHTDRTRTADGRYKTLQAVVTVDAASHSEATMVACQMVHAVRCDHDPMVLACRVVGVVN